PGYRTQRTMTANAPPGIWASPRRALGSLRQMGTPSRQGAGRTHSAGVRSSLIVTLGHSTVAWVGWLRVGGGAWLACCGLLGGRAMWSDQGPKANRRGALEALVPGGDAEPWFRSGEVSSPALHHDRRLWRQRSGIRTRSSTISDHVMLAKPTITKPGSSSLTGMELSGRDCASLRFDYSALIHLPGRGLAPPQVPAGAGDAQDRRK